MVSQFRSCVSGIVAAVALIVCASAAQAQQDDRSFFREDAARTGLGAFRAPAQPTSVPAMDAPQLRLTVRPLYDSAGQPLPSPALPSVASTSSKLVCVRTCDGYFFPVSGGVTDKAIAEFMCQASCPGATTKLYNRAGGDIETAVGTDRSLYTKLKTALAFRTGTSPSCSCRRANGSITSGPVYDDPTLRAGDVIVVGGRAVVFKGAAARPYTERDFAPLERSNLPNEARQKVAALLLFRPSRAAIAKSNARAVASAAPRPSPSATVPGVLRVILPAPFDPDSLPSSVSAFASER